MTGYTHNFEICSKVEKNACTGIRIQVQKLFFTFPDIHYFVTRNSLMFKYYSVSVSIYEHQ
jgi:hypothetical protein